MADENAENLEALVEEQGGNPAASGAKSGRKFVPGEDIDIEAISEIPVEVTVVLGESEITVEELLKMGKGSIIELDKKVGEPVELFVNNRCIAKGEVVVVEDKIGITMTEILKNEKDG